MKKGGEGKGSTCSLFFSLAQLNISYPMLFRLINASQNKHTHAGVLEFIAEEGRAYLPQWVRKGVEGYDIYGELYTDLYRLDDAISWTGTGATFGSQKHHVTFRLICQNPTPINRFPRYQRPQGGVSSECIKKMD
jgi:hypothetical protein